MNVATLPVVERAVSKPPRVALALGGCDLGASGIGVFASELIPRLASRLRTRGAAVLVIGTRQERRAFGLEHEQGPELPSWLNEPGASAAFSLVGLPLLARTLGADVLYLPAANRRIAALPVVRSVGTVHDLAQFHVQNKYGRLRQFYVASVLTPLLRRLHRVTAVSEATARDLAKFAGVSETNIRVIPNGVSLGQQRAGAAARSRPYFLYPARLEHPGKNHVRLIDSYAASSARRTHDLLLVGADWGARALIEAAIHRHGLEEAVQWLGYVPRDTLTTLLVQSAAVVAAGLMEGFGLQAAEALAVGVPVAASCTGSLPEVVGDLGVLFEPRETASIAAALDTVAYDDALRARCRQAGPVRAQRFSWDRAADAIADALWESAHGAA